MIRERQRLAQTRIRLCNTYIHIAGKIYTCNDVIIAMIINCRFIIISFVINCIIDSGV